MAVVRKWIRACSVHTFPIVLLQPAEVSIRNADQFLTRYALGWRNGLEPEFFRFVRLVHFSDVVRTAAPGLEINALYFRNAAQLDAQPQAHQDRPAGLAHRSHERDLRE